jgi:RNA polymerase sigma factor (sigma-70 family)
MSGGLQGSVLRSIQTLLSVGSVGGMTDGQLLEQFLSRQNEAAEAAFAALLALHGPMVWNVCRSVLSDPHAAEDAFQATFLILVRKAASIRRRELVGPWLYGVARRVAVRAKTAAARRRLREEPEREKTAEPTFDPVRREQLLALQQEVDRLPEKYRAPVVLCHLEGRTHAETARLLQCPVGTVSIRLSRARALLRARLTRKGVALPATLAAAMLSSEATAAMPEGLAESTIKVAMQLAADKSITAGGVSAAVAHLAKGELRFMVFTKLTVAAAGILAAGMVTAGVGLLAASERSAQVERGSAPAAAAHALADNDDGEARARSRNNVKHFGLAMHNFASKNDGRFPPAAINKGGKPLLSWRVAILPFVEQNDLYQAFHLDEPWDSPHNRLLLKLMPEVYASPVPAKRQPGLTYYQAFVGKGAMFDGDQGTKLDDVPDGTSTTVLIAEAAEPVPWTKPEDLPFDMDRPLPKLGGLFEGGCHVLMADGSALFVGRTIDAETLRALITRNGGEVINFDNVPRGE